MLQLDYHHIKKLLVKQDYNDCKNIFNGNNDFETECIKLHQQELIEIKGVILKSFS